jgi:hypothetical protein
VGHCAPGGDNNACGTNGKACGYCEPSWGQTCQNGRCCIQPGAACVIGGTGGFVCCAGTCFQDDTHPVPFCR